jgi:hypothetical protein
LRRPPAQPTNGRGGIWHALERSDIHTGCADQNAGIYRDAIELDAAGGPDQHAQQAECGKTCVAHHGFASIE